MRNDAEPDLQGETMVFLADVSEHSEASEPGGGLDLALIEGLLTDDPIVLLRRMLSDAALQLPDDGRELA